jgi:hypothetical protein
MRCDAIFVLMLFIVAAKAPPASALLFLPAFAEMDRQRTPSPSDSHGKLSPGLEAATPRPNPDASGKYHIGDGVSVPRLVFAPDPKFTAKACRNQLGGRLVVSLTVDAAGNHTMFMFCIRWRRA